MALPFYQISTYRTFDMAESNSATVWNCAHGNGQHYWSFDKEGKVVQKTEGTPLPVKICQVHDKSQESARNAMAAKKDSADKASKDETTESKT